MSKIPQLWENFAVISEFMISEGNKVFVKCQGKADGMDTIFGIILKSRMKNCL